MFLTHQRLANEIQRLRFIDAPVTQLGLIAWVRRKGCTWIAAQKFVHEYCAENEPEMPHGTVKESLALTQIQEQAGGQWTIAKPFETHVRYIFDNGNMPPFCRFDAVVSLIPEQRVEIELSPEADAESKEWFPHLLRGILRGVDKARERGRELVGIHIVVKNIDTHPVATTIDFCEVYGGMFVSRELVEQAVPWTR